MVYYGHTKEDPKTKTVLPKSEWQLLKDHLQGVAQLAEERADKIGAGKLGYIIGLTHDLGKYSLPFQRRLEKVSGRVDHSTGGAQAVYKKFGGSIGRALAFTVAGHHGGLPDGHHGSEKNLPARLDKQDIPDYQAFTQEIEIPPLCNEDLIKMPMAKCADMRAFSFSFCIRMLYSCLVDADFLDTERFMNPEKHQARPGKVSLALLFQRLEGPLEQLSERNHRKPSPINQARQAILARCLQMAETDPGFFTLTVPTGGGKTYSSLAFGLKHAVTHGKERVIYVIPYTSIIEQNAQVFREALEDKTEPGSVVLEHHSNFEYPDEGFEHWNPAEKAHRLASENWDMPVVVTTAVQFFESLFANKGSRCRKLHNVVNSVIILDEAQMIPVEYMKPCLWALAELVLNYGVTVVFCTATQPAVRPLIPGKVTTIEIMENPEELQRLFKRVAVRYGGYMTDDQVAEEMAGKLQVLTIVNTRKHARLLFDKLEEKTSGSNYHLSARMCPEHRKLVLAQIKAELAAGKPCRVVATQLIEAGVDVDFPFVYRAEAGLDSVAQAAGRCNREGRRPAGVVVVFQPEAHGMPSKGSFKKVADIARSTLFRQEKTAGDLLSLQAIDEYFFQLFDVEREVLDAHDILKMIKEGGEKLAFPFATISNEFQFIDDTTVAVVVPRNSRVDELMREIEYHSELAGNARKLQPYVVQIYRHELAALEKARAVKLVGGLVWFVTDGSFYDDQFGLKDAQEVQAPSTVLLF